MSDRIRRRAGLIGAGGICPHHVAAIRRAGGIEIVGVHDVDEARAAAQASALGIPAMPSLRAMVDAGADVIHVLTPPHAHSSVAVEALRLGCHVLVEKPLAESVEDCETIQRTAEACGRIASVDHSLLFDPQIAQAIRQVRSGAIGRILSMDIMRSSAYPPFLGGPLPPQYRRAGYPYRDIGVHCLYLFQELLGPIEEVSASWRSFGGDPNLAFDEWRSLARCKNGFGQMQLSWNQRPMQHQIFIHGTAGMIRLDLFAMTSSKRRALPLPGIAQRLLGGVTDAVESLGTMAVNLGKVATKRVRPYQGLHDLVATFYRALDGECPVPVPIAEAIDVVRFTEQIARAADRDAEARSTISLPGSNISYVVTGASGALGSAVVKRLLQRGERVRAFVRRPPDDQRANGASGNLEVVVGNLADPQHVARAIEGARVVIHAGAAMRGGWEEQRAATVEGTRHVLDACLAHHVEKLVHISSMSVIDFAGAEDGAPVDEDTVFEPQPEARGAYTRAKLEAERLVKQYVGERDLHAVILRPGQIFGGRSTLLTPAVARRLPSGKWLVLGDGEVPLPLIYIDDVVDAILLAADGDARSGEVIQLTGLSPTQNEVLARIAKDGEVIRVPRSLLFAAGKLSEPIFSAMGKASPVSAYRLRSALAKRSYRPKNAHILGWEPSVGVEQGIERELGREAREPASEPRRSAGVREGAEPPRPGNGGP